MKNTINEEIKKYPKGYFESKWMALGIAIFSGIGIPLSLITKNFALIGIGPAIGVAIGFSIGQSIENKYQKEGKIRELTKTEKKKRNNLRIFTFALLALGFLLFLLMFYLK